MQKSQGHTLSEYGLVGALVAVAAIGSLALLGHSMQGQFQQISNAPNPIDILKPSAQPAVAASSAAKSGFTLPAASFNTVPTGISDYKEVASSVQTAGANGTTKILADGLIKTAKDELAAGKITETQSNLIIQLANQAYYMAEAEAAIEKVANSSNARGNDFKDLPVIFKGQQTTLYDLYGELGFHQNYDDGLLTDPLNSMSLSGNIMKDFIKAYQRAKENGALNEATVKAMVDNYATQIATIGDAFLYAAQDRGNSHDPLDLSSNMAERLEAFDGSSSQATNENGDGICTTADGKTYTSNGKSCSN